MAKLTIDRETCKGCGLCRIEGHLEPFQEYKERKGKIYG